VDFPLSVNISGSKSALCWLSWPDALRVNNLAQGRDAGEYKYPAWKLTISEDWAPELLPGGVGGISGRGGIYSDVSCLRHSGGGAPVPLKLQRACGLFTVPFCEGRHPAMWLWRSTAGWISIAVFTFSCLWYSTPQFLSSHALVWGLLFRYFISSILACKNHPVAILAIFKARRV